MMRHIDNEKSNKKSINGSYLVEAAVILPIFLLALISVSFLIKITLIDTNAMNTISDELRLEMIDSYYSKKGVLLPVKINNRIMEENENVKDININEFNYLIEEEGNKGLIKYNSTVKAQLKLPINFKNEFILEEKISGRAFIGDNQLYNGFGFKNMEIKEDGNMVYIFPLSGQKYHKKDCSVVTAKPKEYRLTDYLKTVYSPCKICDSQKMKIGETVYCFPNYGDVYHRKGCKTIEKNTIRIDKDIAIKKGYTSCNICGG